MRKFMKALALTCLFVFMCGVTVSADAATNEREITANVVKKGTEVVQNFGEYSYSYTKSNMITIGGTPYYGKAIPIQIPEAGVLHLAFTGNQSISAYMNVSLFDGTANNRRVITVTNTAQGIANTDQYIEVSTPGKYYIALYTGTYYDQFTSNTVSFRPYVVSSKYGSVPVSVSGDVNKTRRVDFYRHDYKVSGKDMYIKYQAKAAGYVTIASKVGYGYVTLCNSKKKALSSQKTLNVNSSYASNKKVIYGVTKGTYYIKVKNYDAQFSLNMKLTKVSEKSGASKSKARTVSAKKTYKGTIVAGNKTVDWYKFKLTKSSRVSLDINGSTNDSFKITVYKGSKVMGSSYAYNDFKVQFRSVKQFTTKRASFSKGTYYIKVERANTQSSGYYSLKWQKK